MESVCPPRWPGPVCQPLTRPPPFTHHPPQLTFHTEGDIQLTQSSTGHSTPTSVTPCRLENEKNLGAPALQDHFMSLTLCSATLTEIFHMSVKLSDFGAFAQASPNSIPSVSLYGFWAILRSSGQASSLMKMSMNHRTTWTAPAYMLSQSVVFNGLVTPWTCSPPGSSAPPSSFWKPCPPL